MIRSLHSTAGPAQHTPLQGTVHSAQRPHRSARYLPRHSAPRLGAAELPSVQAARLCIQAAGPGAGGKHGAARHLPALLLEALDALLRNDRRVCLRVAPVKRDLQAEGKCARCWGRRWGRYPNWPTAGGALPCSHHPDGRWTLLGSARALLRPGPAAPFSSGGREAPAGRYAPRNAPRGRIAHLRLGRVLLELVERPRPKRVCAHHGRLEPLLLVPVGVLGAGGRLARAWVGGREGRGGGVGDQCVWAGVWDARSPPQR